jgi:hypothetical protein
VVGGGEGGEGVSSALSLSLCLCVAQRLERRPDIGSCTEGNADFRDNVTLH